MSFKTKKIISYINQCLFNSFNYLVYYIYYECGIINIIYFCEVYIYFMNKQSVLKTQQIKLYIL